MPRAPKYIAVAPTALAPAPPNLFVGTSGWAYPSWKPGFYPADVPSRAFLHVYAARLTSVEVNYTFRELPSPGQLQTWLDATPPGFRFSFKAPQRITHFQRLREARETVGEFIAALAPARNARKLGPLLFQLPPNFAANIPLLRQFLDIPTLRRDVQIAFEFRHPSWFAQETYAELQRANAALCIAESEDLVTPEVQTANFAYFRLRRSGGYKPRALTSFAQKFAALSQRAETFAYFKHEDEPTGALNATSLLRSAVKLAGVR